MSRARPPVTTAWLNCSAGVAGDMLLAALVDLGADRLAVMDAWASLGLDGFAATFERVDRSGIAATWLNLCIDDRTGHDQAGHDQAGHDQAGHDQAGHDHPGHFHRAGHHHHPHRPAREVIELIGNAELPARVRDDAIRVYRSLAAIEGAVHGVDPDDVELHEVGSIDSILDIVGVCAALDDLGVEELTYSPIGVGHGIAATAHGAVPHPAPATARLIEAAEADIVGIPTSLETATPTGVALLTVLGAGSVAAPAMTVTAVGYGAGTANPDDRANVVQAVVGRRTFVHLDDPTGNGRAIDPNNNDPGNNDPGNNDPGETAGGLEVVHEIATNVDDATPEVIAYTVERLMACGALDAWSMPITMKKSRPGATVICLATPQDVGSLRDVLLAETGSLGARVRPLTRWAADRSTEDVEVDGHRITIKITDGRRKAEYADAAAAARATGRPLRDVIAEAEHRSHNDR